MESRTKARNRKRIMDALLRARSTPSGGLKASVLATRTKFCLRTVQTHLRALRDAGQIFSDNGTWKVPNF